MSTKLNILHVEDNENDAELLRTTLDSSELEYSYKRVDNENDYIKDLLSNTFDVIVADYWLPSFSGLDALGLLEKHNIIIPFIFVSGTLDEENAVTVFKLGASDYLLKNNLRKLPGAIRRSINEAKIKIEKLKAEEKLRESLKEKEVLIREIHHRVKNNLQIISSLIRLQAFNIKNKEFHDIMIETNNRVMAMSLLHQKLYQSESLARVNFGDYPKSLVGYLSNLYIKDRTDIKTTVNVEKIDLDMDTSVPCGLLINEIVTNSLKHAFNGTGGEMSLKLWKSGEEEFCLVISDNGKGLGFDFDSYKGETLGFQLIRSLVSQLNGKLVIDSSNGTKFTIVFSKMNYPARI